MPVYWGVRWDLNPRHNLEYNSKILLPNPLFILLYPVLMERLELSTTAL